MRSIGRAVLSVCLPMLIAACASDRPTPYGPITEGGGYSELKLSADSYRITVRTNIYTSELRAQNMAFLRAAELTMQSGYDRFEVVGGRGVRDQVIGRYDGDVIRRSKGEIVIRMVAKGDRGYADAMDAKLIADQLRPKLRD